MRYRFTFKTRNHTLTMDATTDNPEATLETWRIVAAQYAREHVIESSFTRIE